jgi:hypothetical protein
MATTATTPTKTRNAPVPRVTPPAVGVPLTHSPDPTWLAAGAGTAAQQSARPQRIADPVNGGWGPKATGATAGSPGTFTPAGAVAPANLAAMAGIVATPATAWTVGQHVILGDASHAHWTGTAWAAGNAPVVG